MPEGAFNEKLSADVPKTLSQPRCQSFKRIIRCLDGAPLGGKCATARSRCLRDAHHYTQEISELGYADVLTHPLYTATKVPGKSSNSTSASLTAQQLLKLPQSHRSGPLDSLGRINSFTPYHSLEACFRFFGVYYGGWDAVACCLSS